MIVDITVTLLIVAQVLLLFYEMSIRSEGALPIRRPGLSQFGDSEFAQGIGRGQYNVSYI